MLFVEHANSWQGIQYIEVRGIHTYTILLGTCQQSARYTQKSRCKVYMEIRGVYAYVRVCTALHFTLDALKKCRARSWLFDKASSEFFAKHFETDDNNSLESEFFGNLETKV